MLQRSDALLGDISAFGQALVWLLHNSIDAQRNAGFDIIFHIGWGCGAQ
jgi:hypothetical protein